MLFHLIIFWEQLAGQISSPATRVHQTLDKTFQLGVLSSNIMSYPYIAVTALASQVPVQFWLEEYNTIRLIEALQGLSPLNL